MGQAGTYPITSPRTRATEQMQRRALFSAAPIRGLMLYEVNPLSTGSRTHPWLYSVAPCQGLQPPILELLNLDDSAPQEVALLPSTASPNSATLLALLQSSRTSTIEGLPMLPRRCQLVIAIAIPFIVASTARCEPPGADAAKPAPAAQEFRTDLYGDPLPARAIARLGTVRLCCMKEVG